MAQQTPVAESLLYFYDRPKEPVFFPKGNNDVIFQLPEDYLSSRSKTIVDELPSRFGRVKEEIQIRKIDLPDLSEPMRLGKRENFSVFIPYHRQLAARVIEVLMGMRTTEDFRSAVAYCRENLNPLLFIYSFSVAMLHRPDTRNVNIPPLSETFPDKFIGGGLLNRAREEANIFQTDGTRVPLRLPLDYTASDVEEEHRVAYFREDLGINLHHWHWHLVYPFDGPDVVVRKDRRGELFYYMHQQIVARYNCERFCNKLGRVKRLQSLSEPIKEAYFPKLDSFVASRVWPPRNSNVTLSDVDREQEQLKFDIQDLERWRDRMFDAIHRGTVVQENGQEMQLTEDGGIDILGNIMESSTISINRRYYGNLHNLGHVALALCHDPDNRHLETFGVMGDSATAMRDPVFYRWHAFVDDVFQEHKATLPPYTLQKLQFDNVNIAGFSVQTDGSKAPNQFETTYDQNDVNLTRGMDFTPRGNVFARITHLNHKPFSYTINVNNKGPQRLGTVRIFLAPKFDERGITLLLRDQRLLFIELDRFTTNLKSGNNTIKRKSTESSVTIPFEQTFRDLTTNRPTDSEGLSRFNYCGCGWPQHMLIPKGTPEGFPCELFVMISNYNDDKVDQSVDAETCDDASSYCGIRNKKYPDKRAMGFPFDRPPRQGANTLADFRRNLPNMSVIDVKIRFTPPATNPNIVD
ncbi:phenoloxidase 1-like [Schistocerca cancellata]|uniref:phenoloxidase 1-like n=1 Tax=Schistocerca cancellata TaxID=274614 RepID=UPI0021193AB0|nr:phenoloxidase 1-like [Schistocerca cancellata]